ncbi:glycosyltransferase [Roseomonas populi]|uniref:Glycosyltransferase n=1 Tax=Roseomonas populi TaxID=3121582 RepID=A0ABT1XAU6_9PROT|nr:glycosyltransferase [Roseomonas pecuniae]MCR0985252.1 glycosyltransferase [Roseomonas pecuniae]
MRPLRIAWAGPWNDRSAIAAFGEGMAAELAARGHEVTVLRTEVGEFADLPPRPAPGEVHPMDALGDNTIEYRFDVLVAQIGDNYNFHGALLRRISPMMTVGVFHDAFIANLFHGHVHWSGQPELLSTVPRELYGPESMAEGEPFWTGMEEMARRRPMLEWLARRCAGAVAHAGHYAPRLAAACPGPVATIPLAFEVPDLPPLPRPWNRMTVAAIGYANPNRQLDQVITAIGASGTLRGHCRLRVIGAAEEAERARLTALAELLGVAPPEFTGWVSDEDLRWQLRDVDAITCLRNPVLEGASASVILALASGRPTLVTNHGCYAELPGDTVLACRPEAEALDAMRHLEWVQANPAEAAALGARGQAVALTRHSFHTYADALLPLLEEVTRDRPRREARVRLASLLEGFGLGPDDPATRRAGAVVDAMGLDPAKVEQARRIAAPAFRETA